MESKNFLEISSLKKSYKDKVAVKDISLKVNEGEIIGLLGPNGAGKTTCFYMIVGLLKVDAGKILLNNMDITSFAMHQRAQLGIGYLPQDTSIFRGMTIENNILSVLEMVERSKKARVAKLLNLLDEFSIKHLRKTPAMALSGGERRRVEIARALAMDPKFILLDEPFAGVDPIAVADIMEIIKHLKTKKIGVIITDHNVRETLALVDRAYIVYNGAILAEGRAGDIIHNERVKEVYLGQTYDI